MIETAGSQADATKARELLSHLTHLGWWAPKPEREKVRLAGVQLCELYLAADESTREAIRQLPVGQPSKQRELLRFIKSCASTISSRNETEATLNTRRALAAASIENLELEWRSTNYALRKVYKAAIKAGLDVQAYFEEAIEYSSDQSPHPQIEDHPSMKRFLTDLKEQFHREIGWRYS